MEKDLIQESCFNLATHLMWDSEVMQIEEVDVNISELSEITDQLYNIAIENLELIKTLGGTPEIVAKAIDYINWVHTIPPLKGNYEWFHSTLRTLLELVYPNTLLDPEHILFLKSIEKGIKQSKKDAENN